MNVHRPEIDAAYEALESSPGGLAVAAIERRRAEVGPNRIPRPARPSLIAGFLGELTHFFAVILWLAAALALFAHWQDPTTGMATLGGASEAFLTGSGARIVPVRSLDTEPIGEVVPGPITTRLRDAFFEFARSNGTPIPYPGRAVVA